MLQVDLNDPDYQIAQVIKDVCSAIGRVTSVRVHRAPVPFALVEMSRREHSYDLATRFGGSIFGNCALVHLAHLEFGQRAAA